MADRALRIALCTSGGLHGALVLDRLLATPRVEVVGIVRSTRVMHRSQGWIAGALAFVRRSGLRYAAYLWWSTTGAEWLLRSPPSVSRIARRRGIPVFATADVNDADGTRFLRGCTPDIVVSAYFNQRISEATCVLASIAAVNIHPSLLPRFRGVDPLFYSMLRGDAARGVSVHRISPELDAGAVVARSPMDPVEGESVLAATARAYALGAELLANSLDALAAGVPPSGQDEGGFYDSWPGREEVAALLARGQKLVRLGDLVKSGP